MHRPAIVRSPVSGVVFAACLILSAQSSPSAVADDPQALLAPHFQPPAEFAHDFGSYRSPLRFEDEMPVKTTDDWARRRAEIRAKLTQLLGGTFELLPSPQLKFVEQQKRENYTEHRVEIDVAPGRKVEGYLLVPDGAGPFPAVFVPFYEPLTSIGRGKPDTLGAIDFGLQLTRRGFVTLSIGTPGEIERKTNDTRELLVAVGEEDKRQPLGYLAYVAANCHTALRGLPYVDAKRVGIVGHSYGGKWSLFASCLDDRFAAACWCDPGIVCDESNRSINYWEPWYLGYEAGTRRKPGVPSDENPRTGLYRTIFDHNSREMIELESLICPRPVLVSGGSEDRPHHWRALNHLIAVNKLLGVENRVLMTNRAGHRPTPEAAAVIYAFFEKFLK
jgi:dienelactone hydrolase